jgi:hypothetical protein
MNIYGFDAFVLTGDGVEPIPKGLMPKSEYVFNVLFKRR